MAWPDRMRVRPPLESVREMAHGDYGNVVNVCQAWATLVRTAVIRGESA